MIIIIIMIIHISPAPACPGAGCPAGGGMKEYICLSGQMGSTLTGPLQK